jgi:hypothetical protein
MIKTFELVRRDPGVDQDRFVEAWESFDRDALAAAPSAPHRVVHCAAVPRGHRPARYDAVRVMWHEDAAHRDAFTAFLLADAGRRRAWETLVQPDAMVTMSTDERVARDAAWLSRRWTERATDTVFMMIGFIERKHPMTRAEFRDYWWDVHRPIANRVLPREAQGSAYVQNTATPESTAPWDGVGELYLDSLDQITPRAAFFETAAARELLADEGLLLERATRLLLVTDHRVVGPA